MRYKNILLIDDDDDDQEIFLTALDAFSKTVKCTVINNATEALQKLADGALIPEAIFLDLNMPIMNGQQFLMEIKKNQSLKNIDVIIFSTSNHQATIQLTKELGAHDFITKPNDFSELITILKSFIAE